MLSLPSDVEDDGVEPSDEIGELAEEIGLPSDVEDDYNVAEIGARHCHCKLRCHMKFSPTVVEEHRALMQSRTEAERSHILFERIKDFMKSDADTEHLNLGKIKFSFHGQHVCRPFWEHVYYTGPSQVDKAKKYATAGHVQMPVREAPAQMPGHAASKADAWFLSVWRDLGEPMAIENPEALNMTEHMLIDIPLHPLWNLSVVVPSARHGEGAKRYVPKRYLNPGCFEDLFSMHQAAEGNDAVSRSTLLKCWNGSWKRFLDFRNIGQGNRCKVCAKLDEERVSAVTPAEKAEVATEKAKHLDSVSSDRQCSVRGTLLAEKDARKPTSDGVNQVMKITIDGMDQAKFKCPRNLASSSQFSSLWRPQLHVVGVLVPGHLEAYFIMGSDLAKDANMNCTIISHVLDMVKEKLGDAAMPRSLIISADNTTRESKNQHFATYLATLVSSNKFESVELQFLQVGHTHNEQDQRFSTVATVLSRAPVLETPSDFAKWIRENVKPLKGLDLHVEVLDGTFDFQAWFAVLGIKIGGLASTHWEPDTNHVWNFSQRSLVGNCVADDIECHHSGWASDVPQLDADAVLLLRQFLHSQDFSQAPLLVLPVEITKDLKRDSLMPSAMNDLGERTCKEFLKTAIAVAQPPWNLIQAPRDKYKGDLCPTLYLCPVPSETTLGKVVYHLLCLCEHIFIEQ